MAEFGSEEHVRSLTREQLEGLFRHVFDSRDGLAEIVSQQSREVTELHEKVARQAKQLKEVQTTLERRNRELDALRAENAKLCEEARYLKKGDVLHVLTDQELAEQQRRERETQASIAALDDYCEHLRELVRDLLPFAYDGMTGYCPDRECFMFEECETMADERCHVEKRLEERLRELEVTDG